MLMLCLATPDRRLIDFRGLWMTDVPFDTPFTFGASFGRPFVSTAIEKVRAGEPFSPESKVFKDQVTEAYKQAL